jgi:hypothetical protein
MIDAIFQNQTSFWEHHGFVFIFFMFFFPRLTLILSNVAFGGFFWWLGWIFAPRLLVAILATISYLPTNPVLVFLAWIWAIGLESNEKKMAWKFRSKPKFYYQRKSAQKPDEKKYGNDVIDV